MKLLHVDSGILGEASVSRQLRDAIVKAATRVCREGLEVVRRDLDADAIPHLVSSQGKDLLDVRRYEGAHPLPLQRA